MLALDDAPPAIHTNADAYTALASAAARAAELKRGNIRFPTAANGYSLLCTQIMERAIDSALGGCVDVRTYRGEPGATIEVDRTDVFLGAAEADPDLPLEEVFEAIRQSLGFIGYEGYEDPAGDATLIEIRTTAAPSRPYTALIRNKPLADTAGRTRTFATRAAAEKAAGLALAWSHGRGSQ